jgi:very-short-patch-repair endonuclease
MFQRFGPINSDVGWRRLNVLFTRSKKRMHIFSSMDPDHIQISEKSSRGVRALKAFLAYAKTGHIHQPQLTGKAPDSDFEIAVAKSLSNYGFECVPQVGVAGFFIDLAIKDPGKPGSFLMGIECDGATYHSGKSARDRDRLRQTVLERLGWNIRRIWSTDWFKNPEAQIRPIVEELNKLKTETSLVLEEPETADIDEIITVEDSIDTSTDNAIRDSFTLKNKLIDFDQKIIRLELPDVENDKRILRPAMLEALLHSRPMDMFEFQERIAGYLRADTDSSEGRFLPEILRVIAEDEGFE